MAHYNCSNREVGTINMANLLVIHADSLGKETGNKGHVFSWDEIQDCLDKFKSVSFGGRIQNILNILEVRGELEITRLPEYNHYTAAYLQSDVFWIGSAEFDERAYYAYWDNEPTPEEEQSDWCALLAMEEQIAAAIENATDEELGFEPIPYELTGELPEVVPERTINLTINLTLNQ